ncbi:carboxymuconolactone decarboxylase family protein [Rhizobium sp. PAMB 3174]
MSHHAEHVSYKTFTTTAKDAYAGLSALSKAVNDAGMDKALTELVKIRVSQINGCAFCLQFHITLARKLGVEQRKLDLVAVWKEAGIFSAREMAALAWAEQLTTIANDPVPSDAYDAMRQEFSEEEGIFLTVSIATINAWNRIGAGLAFAPPAL